MSLPSQSDTTPPSDETPRRRRAALSGLLAAAVAMAAAEVTAALVGPAAAPLVAVGDTVIDLTPPWLKDFAVAAFGTADKAVLLGGVGLALAGFALLIGRATLYRWWIGPVGIALLGGTGAAAAVGGTDIGGLAALPALLGAVAGIAVLHLLLRELRPRPGAVSEPPPAQAVSAGEAAPDAPDSGTGGTEEQGPERPVLNRRRFALLAGAAAVLSAGGAAAARLALGGGSAGESRAAVRLPSPASPAPALPADADLELDGLSSFFTPNANFYRIDTALSVPSIDAASWQLRIHGLGASERTYTFGELLARDDLIERDITLCCVSNPVGGSLIGNARWLGVPLAALLAEAGVEPPDDGGPADQLVARSQDGMTIGTPVADVMDGRDAMLALGMNGEPLPFDHGFPVRMVVPGLYGYVSACKWLVDLELTTFDAYDAYWVPRGWADRAPVKTQSRIDVPREDARVEAGTVTLAGVAWAQHVGISAVEVRVDEGPWQQAELSGEATADTWRQWVLDWEAEPGEHSVQVRAVDADGEPQTSADSDARPDGATGLHTLTVAVA